MKKAVVTMLLVLPFILIYFISFTGRILSQYTYIAVERITVLDSEGDEYKENSVIKIGKGEGKGDKLRIKVYPEYASNKNITISGAGAVCSIDPKTYDMVGLEYGEATILITSDDKSDVQYSIVVKVAEDDISAIKLSTDVSDGVPGKLVLNKNRSQVVEHTIEPYTVPVEKRSLRWWSDDPSIATVNQNGKVEGKNYGTTTIWVESTVNPEIKNHFTVEVTNDLQKGIWWDKGESAFYLVNSEDVPLNSDFDLKTITIINNLPISLEDVATGGIKYTITSNSKNIDASDINMGIVRFKQSNFMVEIKVEYVGSTYSDTIRIWYK